MRGCVGVVGSPQQPSILNKCMRFLMKASVFLLVADDMPMLSVTFGFDHVFMSCHLIKYAWRECRPESVCINDVLLHANKTSLMCLSVLPLSLSGSETRIWWMDVFGYSTKLISSNRPELGGLLYQLDNGTGRRSSHRRRGKPPDDLHEVRRFWEPHGQWRSGTLHEEEEEEEERPASGVHHRLPLWNGEVARRGPERRGRSGEEHRRGG